MSKSEEHTKHHYVPQTYLEQFAHSNGKKKNEKFFLYACNRKASKPFTINVEDVCQIPHFYRISDDYLSNNPQDNLNPLSLEVEHFAEYVETNLTAIFKEVHCRKEDCFQRKSDIFTMVENDKYLLAEQIIIQFLRHPKMREYDNSLFDDCFPKVLRLFQQGLAIELNDPKIAELNIGIKKDDVICHAKHSYLNENLVSAFARDLSKNLWTFVYSPDKEFMTSDNPVVCIQRISGERSLNLGLNQKGSIKFFALSPDLLLIMMEESLAKGVDCKFGIASDMCIETYHKALCNQSDEVYSYHNHDKNFMI